MPNPPAVLDDQMLAELLGLSPAQFAVVPNDFREFCRESLGPVASACPACGRPEVAR